MRFPFFGNTVSNWLLIDSFVLLAYVTLAAPRTRLQLLLAW